MLLQTEDKEFVDVFFNKKVMKNNMKTIKNKLHKIGTYDVCKSSLSCFDNKRYILDNDIISLAQEYIKKSIWHKSLA